MAKLTFRYGAMGSSKTANAIMVEYNYRERGQRVLMLKPRLDTRDGERVVASRSGLRAPCAYMEELEQLDPTSYDCIIVDEAQFLKKEQVRRLAEIVDEHNIPVLCYGLRADFQGNLFEGSMWLLAWADSIEEIKTVCWCGKKATYNARIARGQVVKTGEQILLGGNDCYVALCRRHWAHGELGEVEIRKFKGDPSALMPLLLDADPDEKMIERYLADGEIYVLTVGGEIVAEAVVRGEELCNLAVKPAHQHNGYGARLVRHLLTVYPRLTVGTSPDVVPFYEGLGFRFSHLRPHFFKENYAEPVIENGVVLDDMIVLVHA